jgi:hypothetical protein
MMYFYEQEVTCSGNGAAAAAAKNQQDECDVCPAIVGGEKRLLAAT